MLGWDLFSLEGGRGGGLTRNADRNPDMAVWLVCTTGRFSSDYDDSDDKENGADDGPDEKTAINRGVCEAQSSSTRPR